jgi:hypothetical protein
VGRIDPPCLLLLGKAFTDFTGKAFTKGGLSRLIELRNFSTKFARHPCAIRAGRFLLAPSFCSGSRVRRLNKVAPRQIGATRF